MQKEVRRKLTPGGSAASGEKASTQTTYKEECKKKKWPEPVNRQSTRRKTPRGKEELTKQNLPAGYEAELPQNEVNRVCGSPRH